MSFELSIMVTKSQCIHFCVLCVCQNLTMKNLLLLLLILPSLFTVVKNRSIDRFDFD